ncbi:hypothetical protein BMS3Bbin16_00606 [archaeon BMS3Bbin16]|nr:hypothetical protein BMS3Bbin16_00606 [archaeon BMS3Bbin16]
MRGLLISWAKPIASLPIDASLAEWASSPSSRFFSASDRIRSVTSISTISDLTGDPCLSVIVLIERLTLVSLPLFLKAIKRSFTVSPFFKRSSISERSFESPIYSRIFLPSQDESSQPRIFEAASLQLRISSSAPTSTIPIGDASKMLRYRSSLLLSSSSSSFILSISSSSFEL